MKRSDCGTSLLLRRGNLLRLEAVPGDRVGCTRGLVWLTQEGDPTDRVLMSGEEFVAARKGVVLVNALAHDAVLEVRAPARCAIVRAPHARGPSAPSLAAEIALLRPRTDPDALRELPIGARRETVEIEARRLRSQVVWLVLQNLRHGAAGLACALLARARSMLGRTWRALSRGWRTSAN